MDDGDFLSPLEVLSWWNGDTGGVSVRDTVLIISGEERLIPAALDCWPVACVGLWRELFRLLLNSSAKNWFSYLEKALFVCL